MLDEQTAQRLVARIEAGEVTRQLMDDVGAALGCEVQIVSVGARRTWAKIDRSGVAPHSTGFDPIKALLRRLSTTEGDGE